MSVTRTPVRWLAALARKIGLDANPLRRGSDRAEAWVRLGLVVVFLVASPLAAVALGHLTSHASMSAARAQAASERQVTAVLVGKATRASDDPLYGSSELVWARARWTAPDGARRTGEVPAPVGSMSGRRVSIWVDSSGQLVYPPIGQGQIASRVVAVVALTPAALGVILLITLWLTRRFLDRRRMTRWAAEWSAVEPQWTKRLH
ncbi:MAG TPA: hypothetical protein VMV92_28545 [Streptosporangiaceae bacterium]|nr:hypothetical protein [Streptosporangiaceae bacterium]